MRKSETAQQRRHRLRRGAGRLLSRDGGGLHRVARCGCKRASAVVQVKRTASGSAQYAGLETCGSIWLCPVCASKVAAKRADEVAELVEAHCGAGGAVYMATFTVAHEGWQACADLREAVTGAWRKMQTGKGWGLVKQSCKMIGTTRALEITHGSHGWHPHIHVLIYTTNPLNEAAERRMKRKLFARWGRSIACWGGKVTLAAFDLRRATNPAAAAEYVSKWGAGTELAKGVEKLGRGSASPWQLLDYADAGNPEARALWLEYADAMFRARHLTYSKGLRERYGLRAGADDEQLALEVDALETTICEIDGDTWDQVAFRRLTAQVLEAARDGGKQAVDRLLFRNGLVARQARHKPGHAPPLPELPPDRSRLVHHINTHFEAKRNKAA